MAVPNLGRQENSEKWLSQTWEERKIAENGRPKIGKNEKLWKTAFPRLGRLENSEKRLSQTWEERKTLQAEFPTPWKPKNAENHSPLVSEMQKTQKTAFRLQATGGKWRKQSVARVFSSKIAKNSVSLASDERKMTKTARRSCMKPKKAKIGFLARGKIKISENRWFTPVSEQLFLKIFNLLSYLNSFFWKPAIYYRIWTDFLKIDNLFPYLNRFSENWRFIPVSEQFFLKIDDLFPYLNRFSWKAKRRPFLYPKTSFEMVFSYGVVSDCRFSKRYLYFDAVSFCFLVF